MRATPTRKQVREIKQMINDLFGDNRKNISTFMKTRQATGETPEQMLRTAQGARRLQHKVAQVFYGHCA